MAQAADTGAEVVAAALKTPVRRSRLMATTFLENKLAVAALCVLLLVVCFCFIGPSLYHTNQVSTDLPESLQHPSAHHLLGTDPAGYDELGRLMLGGQSSLEVGLAAALLASVIGMAWGTLAGFTGGLTDEVMMRTVDTAMAVPPLIIILIVASITTPTVLSMIAVIAGVSWFNACRLTRAETLSLRTRAYIDAARGMGARRVRIVVRHIAPNLLGTVVVQATLSVADAILLLAGLSYLGLGPPPPAVNWGGMLSQGLNYAYDGYWWLIYPAGVAIVLTVVAFNVLGDALRDAVEVRLQKR
ncbi:MAG: ABC transporter permease [Streptosporangiaceae bacterium]